MLPWLREQFGNPSRTHPYGRRAGRAVATARQQVCRPESQGAQAREIVFTGCATEANNLALLGVARALRTTRRHLVVGAIEHPAVMAPAMALREQGWEVTVVPVDDLGRISLDALERSLRAETALVSVMHANNEVGTVQPIAEIARLTRARHILLHTDAAQSAGRLPLNVDELGVDLLTLAGHRLLRAQGRGRPVRAQRHADPVSALRGRAGAWPQAGRTWRPSSRSARPPRRPSTCCPATSEHMRAMRDHLHERLAAAVPNLQLNGHPEHRLPNTLHISFPGASRRALLGEAADVVAASVDRPATPSTMP